MSKTFLAALALALTLTMTAGTAAAVEVTVTVQNLAPEHGTYLSPVWIGFHDGTYDVYDVGTVASVELERLAEDGTSEPLSADFNVSGAGDVDGILGSEPFGPGEAVTMTFELDPTLPSNRFLSYANMVVPSNDAFVANESPTAHQIFDELGNFVGGTFIVEGFRVHDAGTEVNDEVPMNTAFFGQTTPNTGADQDGTVAVHAGLMPASAGAVLADPDFVNADFKSSGYRVSRVIVQVEGQGETGTVIHFPLSADQEVPPTRSTATGECTGTLNEEQTNFHVECTHNVQNVTAAHIHAAPAGQNGPIVFTFDDPTSPFEGDVEGLGPEVLEALFSGNFYVNVHSPTFPDGEIRGQIVGCFSGGQTLCLNDGRFQVTATYDTGDGDSGNAGAVELTDDTGYFWFFDPDNVEVALKVLNGCAVDPFNTYWVYAGGLTDVEVEIRVTDTVHNVTQVYSNDLDTPFEPIRDTNAFDTCP